MSMQLWSLATAVGPILVVLMAQMLVITLVVVFVVYRAMGRDYDACIISAGFVGLGLGATPVAIANMDAVTTRFGPSPKGLPGGAAGRCLLRRYPERAHHQALHWPYDVLIWEDLVAVWDVWF